MLTKFSITNFKGFNQEFVFNLSDSRGYTFNHECVKNEIINNAIIYGKNGVGKSNLGLAIFDIINHLTDNESSPHLYSSYLNAINELSYATFKYEFFIKGCKVFYEYKKSSHDSIISELFTIDDRVLASIDRTVSISADIKLKGAENLKSDLKDENLSLLKYIKNNSLLDTNKENSVFEEFFKFVEGMLFFRSLESNNYIGLENGSRSVTDDIIKRKNVENFEIFLKKAGIDCKLAVVKESGEEILAFDFGSHKIAFHKIASQGTKSLALFYFWIQRLKDENTKVSFLFIDEFDAFYHHELSELIIEELKSLNVQFVITTHNTALMDNDLLRPDCYFIMNKVNLVSLPNATNKELREAHNLEKLYKANSFNV